MELSVRLIIVFTSLLLFKDVVFGGQAFFSRDITPFFYPMKAFLARSMGALDLPLWNPWIRNGEPFFATLQPGVLYPGNALLYLLPLRIGFGLFITLHYAVAGLGMYSLLRHWKHGSGASALGAIGFMLGGYFVSLGNFPNNLGTVSWAPWLFLAWERYRWFGGVRRALVFSLLCAVAFLGGEPQMLAIILMLLAAFSLVNVPTPDGKAATGTGRGRQSLAFALAGLLALALVAVQLIPFVELLGHSVRSLSGDLDFSAGRSPEPRILLHLLFPPVLDGGVHGFTLSRGLTEYAPWLLSIYPGIVLLTFAALGVVSSASRRWRWFWLGTAGLGLALTVGKHSPLYRLLFDYVPLLRPFRYPEKFYFLFAFAVPILATRGFEVWQDRPTALGRKLLLFAVPVVSYAAAVVFLSLNADLLAGACAGAWTDALLCGDPVSAQAAHLTQMIRGGVIALTLIAIMWFAARSRLSLRLAVPVLIAVGIVDLILPHQAINPAVDPEVYETLPWAAQILAEAQPDPQAFRYRGSPVAATMGDILIVTGAKELSNMYLDYQSFGPNLGQLYERPMQDGLQGVELASVAMSTEAMVAHYERGDAVRFLRLMNVRHYSDPTSSADSLVGLREIATHPELPLRIFEVPDPLPRAYVVGTWEERPTASEALRRALQPDFPMSSSVVIERRPSHASSPDTAGQIEEARFENDRIVLRAAANAPALLVLTDRFYPGWQATVNGLPGRVLRANGLFRAVEIPAGSSEVVFEFRPRSFIIGAWISAGASVAFLLLIFVTRSSRLAASRTVE